MSKAKAIGFCRVLAVDNREVDVDSNLCDVLEPLCLQPDAAILIEERSMMKNKMCW